MQRIEYDYRKLAAMVVGSAVMAALTLWAAWAIGSAVVAVIAGFFALCGGAAANALLTGRPALQFDEHKVTVNTLVSSTSIPWSQIRDVRIESLVLTMYGFIPAGRADYIVFLVAGGMFGTRKVRVSAKLLDRSRSIADVSAAVAATRLAADGAGTAAIEPSAPAADPETGAGFDPDAAVARYLARKAEQEGASPAHHLSPPQPQRPVFGRKQV